MLEPIDQLLTITEVGATFAGFTAIAGVLANEERASRQATINFWIMIEFSFALIVFSLLPIVLFNFGLDDSTVWIASSGLMAAFLPLHLLTVGRILILPAVRRGDFNQYGPLIFVPLFGAVFLVQAANTFGIGFEHSFAAFFLGIAFFVLLVFANFVSLLAQIWNTEARS